MAPITRATARRLGLQVEDAQVANLYAELPSMSINGLPVLLRESAFRL
ncbi:2303_t:CDS:2 [Diversispora eburnea]|uniref:1063_t:CDS:1 n=1 Tax=Diversispora eburnea TaxID=1213867 RepID=A0A9N8Z8B4_9GLOM|nr:1063_t:CDS:2 [Diversispora eburnea]CAG8565748.1 2303_t:CDS:2 [Diversispora eburnea]